MGRRIGVVRTAARSIPDNELHSLVDESLGDAEGLLAGMLLDFVRSHDGKGNAEALLKIKAEHGLKISLK